MAAAQSREHDIREDAAKRLLDTGVFDGVYHYSDPAMKGQKSGDVRAALVKPDAGQATLEYDDMIEGQPLIVCNFIVMVYARDVDPQTRDGMADRLLSVVFNAINGVSLAGLSFTQFTMCRRWKWQGESPPERAIKIEVEAKYETPGWNDFNEEE